MANLLRQGRRGGVNINFPSLGEAAYGARQIMNVLERPEQRRKENVLWQRGEEQYQQSQEDREQALRREKLNFAIDLLSRVKSQDDYSAALAIYSRMYGDDDIQGFPLEYDSKDLQNTLNFLKKYAVDPEAAQKDKAFLAAEERKEIAAEAKLRREEEAAKAKETRETKAWQAEQERKQKAWEAEQDRKGQEIKQKAEAQPKDLNAFTNAVNATLGEPVSAGLKETFDAWANSLKYELKWEKVKVGWRKNQTAYKYVGMTKKGEVNTEDPWKVL